MRILMSSFLLCGIKEDSYIKHLSIPQAIQLFCYYCLLTFDADCLNCKCTTAARSPRGLPSTLASSQTIDWSLSVSLPPLDPRGPTTGTITQGLRSRRLRGSKSDPRCLSCQSGFRCPCLASPSGPCCLSPAQWTATPNPRSSGARTDRGSGRTSGFRCFYVPLTAELVPSTFRELNESDACG